MCKRMQIFHDGFIVCKSCCQISDRLYISERINFQEDMYRVRRKSNYNRKYQEPMGSCKYIIEENLFGNFHKSSKYLNHKVIVGLTNLFKLAEKNLKKRIELPSIGQLKESDSQPENKLATHVL